MKDRKEALPQINERITARSVQLITHTGDNIGVVSRYDALAMARDADLDLVIISEKGPNEPPIAKIMDFGKSLYAKKKKQAEAKKHQKVIQIKEIKMQPKIGEHDFRTKINQAIQFLNAGKRLKITLFFKGREMITKEERGGDLFNKIQAVFEEQGLAKNLIQEPDAKLGQLWSRVYYLKGK